MAITTTPSGGPQGEFSTYTPVYSQTLSSTAASVIFSNVPQGYTDLQIVCQTIASGSALNLTININGDAASNYSITSLYGRSEGAGTGVSSIRANNTTYALANYGTATTTDVRSISRIDVLNYSNNTTFKTIISKAATAPGNSTFSGNELLVNLWRSTDPVTSITLGGGTFAAGSTFTLYGIKAATTQFIPTKAFGGDVITSDGYYVYHTFLSSGTFTVAQSLTADYLVVAGGGGTIPQSSGYYSGGGGGGGMRSSVTPTGGGGSAESALSLTTGTACTVIVGAGAAAAPYGRYGIQGNNSSFHTITSIGGGYGSNGPGATSGNAGSGGSGGGAGSNNGSPYSVYSGGSGTSGQGYAGGSNESADAYAGGAGGGAGGAGGNGSGGKGGTGGAAVSNSISGVSTYYAGGGWGGKGYYGSATIGNSGTGYNQKPFTGMGGVATNAAGQSGIVIVRYAV